MTTSQLTQQISTVFHVKHNTLNDLIGARGVYLIFVTQARAPKINRRRLKEKGVYSLNCNKLYKTKNMPPVNILPQYV